MCNTGNACSWCKVKDMCGSSLTCKAGCAKTLLFYRTNTPRDETSFWKSGFEYFKKSNYSFSSKIEITHSNVETKSLVRFGLFFLCQRPSKRKETGNTFQVSAELLLSQRHKESVWLELQIKTKFNDQTLRLDKWNLFTAFCSAVRRETSNFHNKKLRSYVWPEKERTKFTAKILAGASH